MDFTLLTPNRLEIAHLLLRQAIEIHSSPRCAPPNAQILRQDFGGHGGDSFDHCRAALKRTAIFVSRFVLLRWSRPARFDRSVIIASREVLALLSEQKWPIYGMIEFEYPSTGM
jgi:hypothetical protein